MGDSEVNFPRGGAVIAPGDNQSNNSHLVFDHVAKKKKKRTKQKHVEQHLAVTGPQPKILSLEDLSYKIMSEGMLVLGCVKEIYDNFLNVVLPGLTEGSVPITHISDPYTKLLQSANKNSDIDEECHPLSDMFYKGQHVVALISCILQSDYGRHEISLNLSPSVVNSDWSHSSMAKVGLIITAAVLSIEEHGYVMDCGVKSLRCFLKRKLSISYCDTFNAGKPLVVGQLLRCLVIEAEVNAAASKIQVTIDPVAIAKQESAGCVPLTVQQLLPGTCCELAVLQGLKGGVKTKIINVDGIEGFVHESHLPINLSDKNEGVIPGSKHLGRLLYITPLVKTPYFSLLPCVVKAATEIPKCSRAQLVFSVGCIINRAEIFNVSGKGIVLLLKKHNDHAKGFVPLRRSGFNLKRAEEDNTQSFLQLIRSEFPIGNRVKCRVLHFDSLSEVFICSMEKHVLEEKFFTLSDFCVGDVVPCTVQDIQNGGIVVKVGMVTGFVPATHSADIPLKFPEQKFQPGLEVKGRVMKVDLKKHRMIVTFKPSLISCEPIITSYEDAKKGYSYCGTVVAVTKKGVMVAFFGGVRGFLAFGSTTVPEGHTFFEGQVLNCYVIKSTDVHIHLSLFPHPSQKTDVKHILKVPEKLETKEEKCEGPYIGHQYNLEVVSVDRSGIHVKVISENCLNIDGFIPSLHLSDDVRIAPLLCDTFETGQKLDGVCCYRGATSESVAIFSLRGTVRHFFESIHGKILKKKTFEAVSVGCVIPCTVEEICADHILLQVPLPRFSSFVRVDKKNVCNRQDDSVDELGLVKGQGIQAKILQISYKKRLLSLGCSLNHVWDGELESCTLHLLEYLKGQQRLLEYAKKKEDALGFFSANDEVNGTVNEKTKWGYILNLHNGVRGEVTFFNAMSVDLEIGTNVSGRVLFVDFLRQHVEISLLDIITSSSQKSLLTAKTPKIEPPVRLHGPTLLVTPEFILVQVKWVGDRFLAFIPTKIYPYMSSSFTVAEPYFGLDRKLISKCVWNEYIICLPMELVRDRARQEKKKAKRLERLQKNLAKQLKTENGEKLLAPEEIKIEKDDSEIENSDSVSEGENFNVLLSDDEMSVDNSIQLASKRKISSASDEDISLSKRIKSNSVKQDVMSQPNLQLNDSQPCASQENECSSGDEVECLDTDKLSNCIGKKKQVNELIPGTNRNSFEINNPATVKFLQGGGHITNTSQSSKSLEEKESQLSSSNSSKDSLNLRIKSPGFLWDVDPKRFLEAITENNNKSSSDDSDEDTCKLNSPKKNRKKSAAERRDADKLEEDRLQRIERDLMNPNRQPTSCDDFDRMVLADPNNSAIWLQYMAFYMQSTEIEKARSVAQRAIKTINYREENEKLNVWLGLLNLENLYGTPSSLSSVLQDALQYNDSYKIHIHMIRIYAESGKNHELDNEVKLVIKKFKDIPGMWLEVCSILMNNGQAERARKVLDMSLPHLKNKQESTSLVVQFALLESKQNNLERAKALLESLLASYPQRVDVWCTYCDMLVKANLIDEARQLLERCACLKLQSRKMKTLFAKFLKFEESHGTSEGQERVRKLAVEYVNQLTEDIK